MNTRAKGRKFEKREEAVWKEYGWETELVRPEARFIGPGKAVTAYRDFYGRYDIMALWPEGNIMCLVQVSSGPPSTHADPGPFGFKPPSQGGIEVPVNLILVGPKGGPFKSFEGIYEVYAQYARHGAGPYEAQRQWWKKRPTNV